MIAFHCPVVGFELDHDMAIARRLLRILVAAGPHVPRDVGLLMIAGGIGSLALFTWQYLRAVDYLGAGSFAAISIRPGFPMHQLSCFVSYAIMLIGAVALASLFVSF